MTTDQKWAKRSVVSGIGWPGQVRKAASKFSTGIGWPSTRENPQQSPSYPQGRVSRETSADKVGPGEAVARGDQGSTDSTEGDSPQADSAKDGRVEDGPADSGPLGASRPETSAVAGGEPGAEPDSATDSATDSGTDAVAGAVAAAAAGTAAGAVTAAGAGSTTSTASAPPTEKADPVPGAAPDPGAAAAGSESFDPSVYAAEDSTPLARQVAEQIQARARVIGQPLKRVDDTRIMVVANQKGGVGKTTTTVNLAAALAQHGLRVLVVDLDPQGNASTALSVDHQRGVVSTYDVLVDGTPLAEATHAHPDLPNLFCAPATIDLAGAEVELVNVMSRESRLKKALAADPRVHGNDEERYDYVFIDCPPSLGLLTLNALVAGEEVLIPIQAEYYALEGLGQLIETVDMVRTHLNQELSVSSILITMYDGRTRLASAVADEVRGHFGEQVLRTSIPRSVRVSEAPSYGQSVMTYDPSSPGALSYLEAARELNSRRIG